MAAYIVYRSAENGRNANQEDVALVDAASGPAALAAVQAAARMGAVYGSDAYTAVLVSSFVANGARFLRGQVNFPT